MSLASYASALAALTSFSNPEGEMKLADPLVGRDIIEKWKANIIEA